MGWLRVMYNTMGGCVITATPAVAQGRPSPPPAARMVNQFQLASALLLLWFAWGPLNKNKQGALALWYNRIGPSSWRRENEVGSANLRAPDN